jgi:hypothetical protein
MYLKNIWFRNNPGNADKAAEEFLETTQIIQVGQYTEKTGGTVHRSCRWDSKQIIQGGQ